ncbi:MAG: GNAT family N-acetyltransferase [Geodermatophilaceae bacterium]|nr:GNAT family N-acetyltransferase [Geodermatophilaceae bacterium]
MAPQHPGWPATLRYGRVGLRPLRRRDGPRWSELRMANERWLAPWEPSSPYPWAQRHSRSAFRAMLRVLRAQARVGASLPFAVCVDDRLVGQMTVSNVARGVLLSGHVGYWIDREHAGQGVTPTALALLVDHCFGPVRLHRIQADIRPENGPSRRVVTKLGFRQEAEYVRYLDIDGQYRDHLGFALTVEDVPDGLLRRFHTV